MPTKLNAILSGKCPKCRTGNIFKYEPQHVFHAMEMNKTCPHCGVHFEIEPGFFQAAMFVSYGFSVAAMFMVNFGIYFIDSQTATWVYVAAIVSVTLLIAPYNFRYSRILLLYWFSGLEYDRNLAREKMLNVA